MNLQTFFAAIVLVFLSFSALAQDCLQTLGKPFPETSRRFESTLESFGRAERRDAVLYFRLTPETQNPALSVSNTLRGTKLTLKSVELIEGYNLAKAVVRGNRAAFENYLAREQARKPNILTTGVLRLSFNHSVDQVKGTIEKAKAAPKVLRKLLREWKQNRKALAEINKRTHEPYIGDEEMADLFSGRLRALEAAQGRVAQYLLVLSAGP